VSFTKRCHLAGSPAKLSLGLGIGALSAWTSEHNKSGATGDNPAAPFACDQGARASRRRRILSHTDTPAISMPITQGSTAAYSLTLSSKASALSTRQSIFAIPPCPAARAGMAAAGSTACLSWRRSWRD